MSVNITNDGDGLVIPVLVPQGAGTLNTLERIAVAVEALGAKTEKAGEKSAKASDDWAEKIKKVAEWYSYVSGAVTDFSRRVTDAAEHIAASASEADRLSRAQQRLHVSFAEAAAGAGGFVSEMDAMNATQTLAARDLQLTQREVNALTRVAQDYARGTGREFREVSEQLAEAVAKGGEEIGRFGGSLGRLATGSHTTEERLRALVTQAEQITPATRTASERMEAFREALHNADRTFSQSFVEGITRLEAVATATQRSRDNTVDWNARLRDLGQTAATVTAFIISSFNLAAGAIQSTVRSISAEIANARDLVTHPFEAGSDAMNARLAARTNAALDPLRQAFHAHEALTLEAFGRRRSVAVEGERTAYTASGLRVTQGAADMTFTAEDVAAAERDARARNQRTGSAGGGSNNRDAKSAKAAQMAEDQAARDLEAARQREAQEYLQRLIAFETERARLSHESAAAYGEQVTHLHELDRIAARIAGLSTESGAANEVRLTRARSAQSRAEARIGQRATLEDLRDPAVEAERAEDAARSRQIAREERAQQRRIDSLQSFTERWRDLHEQQVDVTAETAGTLTNAFTSMGNAFAKHAEAFQKGEETIGQALKGMLADALESIGKEAWIKSGFFLAEGLGKLVMYDFPGAGVAFATSAAYAAVGAAAIAGSSAVAPQASKGAAAPANGGASSSPSRSDRLPSSRSANDNGSGTTVIYQYFAPVIDGRSATDAQVGDRFGRFSDATTRRQVRARAA